MITELLWHLSKALVRKMEMALGAGVYWKGINHTLRQRGWI
jgi:hypothetical protein